MAYQKKAANGEQLNCRQWTSVLDSDLQLLGLDKLPNGMVGYNFDTGLVKVISKPDQEPREMRIGRFLKRQGIDEVTITNVGANAKALADLKKQPLKITTSSEEVVKVYSTGVHSCMKGMKCVGVYATDDVAVAYMEHKGETIARAVINKKDKKYGRVYGVENPLKMALKADGYTYNVEALEGCRVLRLTGTEDKVRMPYIDQIEYCEDYGDFMVITGNGDIGCQSADGYIYDQTCCNCGDSVCDDEGHYSEYMDEMLCGDCFHELHVHCEDDWEYYHVDQIGDGVAVLENGNCVLMENAAYIEYRDEWHHREDCTFNEYTKEYILNDDIN